MLLKDIIEEFLLELDIREASKKLLGVIGIILKYSILYTSFYIKISRKGRSSGVPFSIALLVKLNEIRLII